MTKPKPANPALSISHPDLASALEQIGAEVDNQPLRSSALARIMRETFHGSDAGGAWDWRMAYDLMQAAAVQVLLRGDGVAGDIAAARLLASRLLTETRRSEQQIRLQQFSTPLPFAALTVRAAAIRKGETVLEPSAGTGALAAFAARASATLVLNEIDPFRQHLLRAVFGGEVTGHDGEHIDDLLQTPVLPDVVVMNPPFASSVDRSRDKHIAVKHLIAAAKRLAPCGRLVAIMPPGFTPERDAAHWSRACGLLTPRLALTMPGQVYRKLGTTVETQLMVFDKVREDGEMIRVPVRDLDEALACVDAVAATRTEMRPGQQAAAIPHRRPTVLSSAPRKTAAAPVAASKPRANAVRPLSFTSFDVPRDNTPISDIYARYRPQRIEIAGAQEHPTPLVESIAMASVAPPVPSNTGSDDLRLPARLIEEGHLSEAQLETIVMAHDAHPRKSQIDVVQSVGRVMRRAEGKKMGYVILPVGVPAGVPPEQALNDNERYRVVWQILNALRAHDERFDSTINKMSLGQDISDTIEIIGINADSEELKSVTAVVETLPNKTKAAGSGIGSGNGGAGDDVIEGPDHTQTEMTFSIDEFSRAIMAKIVKKCGTRDYWEDWSASIAEIAKNHITRLTALLKDPDTEARHAFDAFLAELRDDLNDTISEGDAIEMLAQHIITRPVFETLFEGHKFTAENPVSRAMQRVLDVLNEANLDKESRDLEKFYASVKLRSQGITDPQAKQKLIVELYDKFFRRAFPRTTEKLGIVYTPVEIVDFIIHSVNEVLQSEFGQTLGSPGVHIIDPFTGTGTFITRLLQSGLIAPEEMEHKFRHEIHANEIVLLAYYIAAINIEAVYHGLQGGDYVPFEGICLTDTFQMYESDDLISHYMPDNSKRRKRQKATDIRVIVGNPPYSAGQGSANDNNANVAYPTLDARIRDTYAARSSATNKSALYDSYIRAFRWASDRIGDAGVMAYVSNAGWVDGNAADGMRAYLKEEFSNLYVFHLRGNARTSGEQRRRERGNVFGEGSRTPVAISVLVKNSEAQEVGQIFFHDIGDYLDQKQKLSIVRDFGSIAGISSANLWTKVVPDDQNDWLNQRDKSFEKHIMIGDKEVSNSHKLFEVYSRGVVTARDAWCYNTSKSRVAENMARMANTFNQEVYRYNAAGKPKDLENFIDLDPRKISWNRGLKSMLSKGQEVDFTETAIRPAVYRPFEKAWLYFDRKLNDMVYQVGRIFPNADSGNRVIWVTSPGAALQFSCFISNSTNDAQTSDKPQCFPLFVYDVESTAGDDLFSRGDEVIHKRSAITDAGLKHFEDAYPGETITKEDLFYYVYGLLHSEDYRAKYADNLSKELPRIPRVKTAADFWAFSRAGRELGDLHVNYETVEPYPVTIRQGDLRLADIKNPESFYRVTKWAFGKAGKEKDKTTVIYNANITMTDVPLAAYDYVVNGKPALEWVMERQVVKTDKASGIVNDANRYAIETMNNPAYPLELFQRVIAVSLRTMEIVRGLPKLEVME